MKTNTYLRWSLLIPLLVWVLCLVFFLIAQVSPFEDSVLNQSITILELLVIFAAFYLFGIIVWLLPYLLISLILFFSSFIAAPRLMIKVYALSPLVMTVLTLALMNILLFFNLEDGMLYSSPISSLEDFTTSTLAIGGIILLWGYICVGIGFGIYKLLQSRGMIRDAESAQIASISDQPA